MPTSVDGVRRFSVPSSSPLVQRSNLCNCEPESPAATEDGMSK